MRRALKEGGLEMYYQPEYGPDGEHLRAGGAAAAAASEVRDGGSGALHSHCRGERPDCADGELGAARSVPAERGVARARDWRVPRIAINVSPLQFMRMDFSRQVRQAVLETGVAPDTLEIEMTETTVMRNLDDLARQMRELAELGVHFSVDDFGTGYSSLQHLHQLPIERLKIDRSFIERVCEPNGTSALVQAILSLAHSLGLEVVAEGVEREQQAEVSGADEMRRDAGIFLRGAATGRGDSGADPYGACAADVEGGGGGSAGVRGCGLEPAPRFDRLRGWSRSCDLPEVL